MQALSHSAHRRTPGHAAQNDTVVIGLMPDPSQQGSREQSCDLGLPPEVTHGCVEWFDYKSHPLEPSAAHGSKRSSHPVDVPETSAGAVANQARTP